MAGVIERMRWWLVAGLVLVAGCSGRTPTVPISGGTPTAATPSAVAQQAATQGSRLTVSVLYPTATSELEMGQALKLIARIMDARGSVASEAQVTITVRDPAGKVMGTVPAKVDDQGVFRSEAWPLPHRVTEGTWSAVLEAKEGSAQGSGQTSFRVKNSTSETLLAKYGFWLDAPALKGVNPQLFAEKGDARNGMIIWGGGVPGQHVLIESWVELNWREGNAGLTSPEAVRRFMLGDVGDLGVTPIRSIGPFTPMRFKQWDAWRVDGRGQYQQDHVQWVAFYAPEVNKTILFGTKVVQPPAGVDAHALLRDSFELEPQVHASGTAPQPLPKLLPEPELLSPPLGAQFEGLSEPVVLKWKALKTLAPDEFYEVDVDYNYGEGNFPVKFTTRETELTLPTKLYQTPNCTVFNWTVTLKRQTGTDASGQPKGEALSFTSLYWYLQWFYPAGTAPFSTGCPNAQF